jgi:hypothetical protein
LSWSDKLALDTWYVDHRSLRLDLKILLMTVAKVVSRSGIAAEGSETMPEFRGSGEPDAHPPFSDRELGPGR